MPNTTNLRVYKRNWKASKFKIDPVEIVRRALKNGPLIKGSTYRGRRRNYSAQFVLPLIEGGEAVIIGNQVVLREVAAVAQGTYDGGSGGR